MESSTKVKDGGFALLVHDPSTGWNGTVMVPNHRMALDTLEEVALMLNEMGLIAETYRHSGTIDG